MVQFDRASPTGAERQVEGLVGSKSARFEQPFEYARAFPGKALRPERLSWVAWTKGRGELRRLNKNSQSHARYYDADP